MNYTRMATVYVSYSGDADTQFDRPYYRTHHLPLVKKSWGQYGLQNATALYPEQDGKGIIAFCALQFRDEAAVAASLASKEAPEVMGDITNFTAVKPTITRAAPLSS